MAQVNTEVVALQLEKVRDKIPLLYERDDILLTMIEKRGDVEKVSSRNMRIPLQINPGGKGGMYNADGGDLGRGSGTRYEVAQVTPIFFRFATEITKLVEYATNSSEKAVENAAKREVTQAMKQFRTFLDQVMQSSSDCVIGTISDVSATPVLTMSVPFGAALVYVGQTIQIWNAALTTLRGSAVVTGVDSISATQTITVDVDPGAANTDVITFDTGATSINPVGLFGVPYHQNNAVTGTWLNLNRATYPTQLQTPAVNAASSALTPQYIRLAKNKQRKALGTNYKPKLIAYTSLEQQAAYENLGLAIRTIMNQGGRPQGLETLFDQEQMNMDGTKVVASIHANQTRIDFLDLSHWGRAVMKEVDYFKVGSTTVFPIYGASGGISAAYVFYFDTGFQVFVDSPRAGAFIYSLTRPSGY